MPGIGRPDSLMVRPSLPGPSWTGLRCPGLLECVASTPMDRLLSGLTDRPVRRHGSSPSSRVGLVRPHSGCDLRSPVDSFVVGRGAGWRHHGIADLDG